MPQFPGERPLTMECSAPSAGFAGAILPLGGGSEGGRSPPPSVMRVLHVSPYFAPAFVYGGPPRSVLGLCRALLEAGIDVEVFTTTANGGADLPPSPPGGDRYAGVKVRYFPLAFPRRLFRARGLGRALGAGLGDYDLVHIHGLWTLPGWAAARHARRRRVPYVLSPHGMLDAGALAHRAARKRLAYRLVERRTVSGAALLHATSSAEAESVARIAAGVPVAMVPNGVDMPEGGGPPRGAFRRRHAVPDAAPLAVFLGRVHPIKRLDLLAAAFDRVRGALPAAHLVIAGPDEDGHRRRLEPCFAGAGPAVHWTGRLDDAARGALLADADALVMCSDSESFGRSALEALAAAVPVVVTRGCPWEHVERVGAGFWVPQSAEAIADGLLRLLRDPALARAMGERGRALARAEFSWDRIARAMADRYEAVARARPRRAAAS